MKQLLLFALLCTAFMFPASALSKGGDDIPEDIQRVAAEECRLLAEELMGVEDIEQWGGFQKEDDLSKLALDVGYKVTYVDRDALAAAPGSVSMEEALRERDEWEFILSIDGAPKTFLSVGYDEYGLCVFKRSGGDARPVKEAFDTFSRLTGGESPKVAVNGRDYYLLSEKKEFSGMVVPVFALHSYDENTESLRRMNQTFINADAIIEAYQLKAQDYAQKYGNQAMGGDAGIGGYLTEQAAYRETPSGQIWPYVLFPAIALCVLAALLTLVHQKNKRRIRR